MRDNKGWDFLTAFEDIERNTFIRRRNRGKKIKS